MIVLKVDRDSVHAGDDISSHEISMNISGDITIEELVKSAIKQCFLPSISGGNATWLVYSDSEPKQYIGVLAQQWKKPKLLINSTTTASSIFTTQPAKLVFRYWCQSDPNSVFKALLSNTELPSKY